MSEVKYTKLNGSGTYTPQARCEKLKIYLAGGGGGGSGAAESQGLTGFTRQGGGGGGSGEFRIVEITSGFLSSYSYNVGTSGSGSSAVRASFNVAESQNGGAGGISSFGSNSAAGGSGGEGAFADHVQGTHGGGGGAGGTGHGGSSNSGKSTENGGTGGDCISFTFNGETYSFKGGQVRGGGGQTASGGAGGLIGDGGDVNAEAGGNGGAGIVWVEETYDPTPPSYTVTLQKSPSAGGSVSGGGSYYSGDSCTARATAASGYRFINWTSGSQTVSTSANYTFTVTGNVTLIAHFEAVIPTYQINVDISPAGSGTVTGAGEYEEGEVCTLTATPAAGWDKFKHWLENGGVRSTANPYTFSVSQSRNLTAVFAKTVEVYASAAPSGAGTVEGSGRYDTGDKVTMKATANTGYAFTKWKDDTTHEEFTSNPYEFFIQGNRYLTAMFSSQKYTVSLQTDPSEGGEVTGGGEYLVGTPIDVKATAAEGHTFLNWTKNGVIVSTESVYSFTVSENVTLVAHFAARIYQIAVEADPPAGGTAIAEPPQTTIHGRVICKATAAEGYSFINWTEKGEIVSTESEYRIDDVTDDHQLTAHFGEPVLHHFKIVFDDNGGEGGPGTIETDDYAERITVTVPETVPTLEGKIFAGWLVEGTEIVMMPDEEASILGDVVYTLIAQWIDEPSPAANAELWYKDVYGWRKVADFSGPQYVFDAPLIREGTHVGTDASLHEVEWSDVIIEKRRR